VNLVLFILLKANTNKNFTLNTFLSAFTLYSTCTLVILGLANSQYISFAPSYCSHFNIFLIGSHSRPSGAGQPPILYCISAHSVANQMPPAGRNCPEDENLLLLSCQFLFPSMSIWAGERWFSAHNAPLHQESWEDRELPLTAPPRHP
jgi:hypothetical protein